MEMNYCVKCGAPLKLRYHEHEGKDIPWCENCGEFRYPFFNCAVSMIVMNEEKDKVYLIKQYGKDSYICKSRGGRRRRRSSGSEGGDGPYRQHASFQPEPLLSEDKYAYAELYRDSKRT